MASVVYFKLKNAVQQNHVNFDGAVIQIGDVKRLVAQKQGLGPEGASELTLFEPATGDEYTDDGKVIPRNTLVIVKRAPATKLKPLLAGESAPAPASSIGAPAELDTNSGQPGDAGLGGGADFGGDLYSEQPSAPIVSGDETRALENLLQGSAANWQREVRQGTMRGRGRGRGRGSIPFDYRCPRCEAVGAHWLQDCPTQGDPNYDRKRVRPPVGIPMTRLARSDEGGLVLPDGNTGTLVANEDAWAREIMGLGILGDSTGAPEGPSAAGTPVAEAPAPVLALDSVPAEVRQAEEAKTAAAAAGPVAIVPPIMAAAGAFPPPKLAGDDEHGGGAPGMPGSSFFDLYMRSALLPRGPPAFVEEAFKRDAPLRKSEFERLQDSYRRRFNLSPVRRRRSRSRSRSRSRRRSHRSRSRSKDRSSRQRHSSRERERDSKRSRSEKEKEEDKGKSKSRRKDDVKERSRGTDKERDKDRKERDKETSKARKDGDKKEERGSKGDTKQDADAACAGDTKAEVGAPGTNERETEGAVPQRGPVEEGDEPNTAANALAAAEPELDYGDSEIEAEALPSANEPKPEGKEADGASGKAKDTKASGHRSGSTPTEKDKSSGKDKDGRSAEKVRSSEKDKDGRGKERSRSSRDGDRNSRGDREKDRKDDRRDRDKKDDRREQDKKDDRSEKDKKDDRREKDRKEDRRDKDKKDDRREKDNERRGDSKSSRRDRSRDRGRDKDKDKDRKRSRSAEKDRDRERSKRDRR